MTAAPEDVWTDERIQTLKRLWGQGCTQADIAEAMGLRPSQVGGKVKRLREELGFRQVRAMQRNHGRYMARLTVGADRVAP